MRQPARLALCRIGFLLFGLLPTLVVGGWIVHRSLPQFRAAQQAEWEHELSQRLGMRVAIGRLSYSRPGVAQLADVQLSSNETGDVVATLREVEVTQTDDGWQVEASQPVVDVAQLAQLGAALHDRLLRAGGGATSIVRWSATDATLQRGAQALSLRQLSGVLDKTESNDPRLMIEFLLADAPAAAAPGKWVAVRNRQMRPPTTRWEIDTAGASLPCWLAVDAVPQLGPLGAEARFSGSAVWMQTGEGLAAQVSGRLNDVDLDSLVSERFPHQLSGLATVSLEPATIEAGRLVELRGAVQARDGWVSPSLLAAASEHLGLESSRELDANSSRPVTFRQLSLGFALSDRTLLLTGGCDASRSGVILANASGSLLEAPPQHQAAAVNLLRTLLPESEWQVPATRQTGALAALLPAPDVAREQTARRQTHVPTRLAPGGGGGSPVRQPR